MAWRPRDDSEAQYEEKRNSGFFLFFQIITDLTWILWLAKIIKHKSNYDFWPLVWSWEGITNDFPALSREIYTSSILKKKIFLECMSASRVLLFWTADSKWFFTSPYVCYFKIWSTMRIIF
jgi:hypothetical protein